MKLLFRAGLPLLTGVLLAACGSLKNEVSPGLIQKQGIQYVVNCYISPQDTLLAATVSLTNPVLTSTTTINGSIALESRSTVTLADGDRFVVLPFDRKRAIYAADPKTFPIREGRTYTLTVKTADGQTLTSTATVPTAVPIQITTLDSIQDYTGTTFTKEYTAQIIWRDAPGQADFYRVAGQFVFTTQALNASNKPQTGQSSLFFRRNRNTGDFVNDELLDGDVLTSVPGYLGIRFNSSRNSPNPQAELNKLTLGSTYALARLDMTLLHTDEAYYRYHEAVLRQRDGGGNPFAEPILIPNNITGGLGCFGAYNRTMATLKVK